MLAGYRRRLGGALKSQLFSTAGFVVDLLRA